MRPLSKEAEEKIVSALNQVIDLVNDGVSPTDAIAKVASAEKLPAGHINLMVNAFNIGRSEAQRKGSSDLFEKVSEFELADASQVLERMFPAVVKSSGVLERDEAVSSQYSTAPRFLLERAKRQKLAHATRVIDWSMTPKKPDPLPRDPHTAVKRAYARLVDHKRLLEETRRAAQHFFDEANGMIEKFAEYMKRPQAPLFREVRENAVIMFGEKAAALLDRLAKVHRVLTKQSALGRNDPIDGACEAVGKILDKIESFELARKAYDKVAAEHEKVAEKIVRPFVSVFPKHGSVIDSLSTKSASEDQGSSNRASADSSLMHPLAAKLTSGMFSATRDVLGSSLSGLADSFSSPPSLLQQRLKSHITDPQHEAQLRLIQTEAMLHDLMANDEVISGYDPNEVIEHFNEISQLAPRASNQEGLMRSLLRKRLQTGAFDPYEIEMLLKIENSLKLRDNPVSGGVLGGSLDMSKVLM